MNFEEGDRVTVDGYAGEGTVLFVGFHINTGGARVGVSLDGGGGNNNGVVKGQ